ncbi:hypothetical protein [Polaribacter sp. Hel_I_88]|uniref:hypothetical protein n=1 Tax=Polaribacter sp. Hel_I_88 TaxID=1250006 RepID=UPI00047BDB70|nr:hypothetical protein [Polaribacter sp. Hel_I_88]
MKKNNIKIVLKYISDISIVSFGILYIIDRLFDVEISENDDVKHILILIYVASTIIYQKMELKDKNAKIKKLESELKKNK